jgi:hypothetical protein
MVPTELVRNVGKAAFARVVVRVLGRAPTVGNSRRNSALSRYRADGGNLAHASLGVRANLRIDHRESEMWADPILGARLGMKLSGPWSSTIAGDVGGLGVGSDLTWQALGSVTTPGARA